MKYNRRQACYDTPVNVNIALTERCNLQCPFCFHEHECKHDLDFAMLKGYLKQLADIGAYCVQYSGGDPLLYPYLEEAIEYAHELGLYTRLSTSGSMLTVAYAERLKRAGLDCCHISLNGSTQEIHEKTRDGFLITIEALHIVSEIGIPCTINWVANHENIPDLVQVIILAQSLKVDNIDILANKTNHSMKLLFPYNQNDLLKLKQICEKYPDYLHVENCFNELRLLLYGAKIPIVDKGCKAGRFHMAVDAKGKFLPCPHLNTLSDNSGDILAYWNTSPVLKQMRESFQRGVGKEVDMRKIGDVDSCITCHYKRYCNPCYIEQEGQLMRNTAIWPCVIGKAI